MTALFGRTIRENHWSANGFQNFGEVTGISFKTIQAEFDQVGVLD